MSSRDAGVAERAQRPDQVGVAAEDRDLRLERGPVVADERPARGRVPRGCRRTARGRAPCPGCGAAASAPAAGPRSISAGSPEVAERVQIPIVLLGRRPRCSAAAEQRVEQRGVAVDRRGGHDRARQGRIERRAAGERRGRAPPATSRSRPDRGRRCRASPITAARSERRSSVSDAPGAKPTSSNSGRSSDRANASSRRSGRLGRQVVVHEAEAPADLVEHAAGVLAAVAGGERQVVADGVAAGADQRPLVVEQRQPLRRGQIRLDVRRHRASAARADTRSGSSRARRRWRTPTARRRRRCSRSATPRSAPRRSWRRGRAPSRRSESASGRCRGGAASSDEALLLQRDRRLVVRAGERDVEQRHARLVDERRQDALDRLARRRGDRLREVLRGRVAVGVRLRGRR